MVRYADKTEEFPPARLEALRGIDPELLRLYYSHQYERYDQHESQRMTFGNIILATSLVALGLAIGEDAGLGRVALAVLPLMVAAANLCALGFIWRTGELLEGHRTRGRLILQAMAPELADFNRETRWPTRTGLRGRSGFVVLVHGLLVIAGIWLALARIAS